MLAGFTVRRTRHGRWILAVGGNAEAARRAGVNVARVRPAVFTIASSLAAPAGLFRAARAGGASKSPGPGNPLIDVAAAAVIGGTRLFGGRGGIRSALLDTPVIQPITTGPNLVGTAGELRYTITGVVLLVAVVVDSVSRRTRRTRHAADGRPRAVPPRPARRREDPGVARGRFVRSGDEPVPSRPRTGSWPYG
ncbi:hypothetical protein GCM10027160_31050 [Streptomyces calidiresistens]|uniref:ABC transporter permease subunit n=1 Tax=Streptomyces calidiresistens TaxID=1485586 RepID=UPI002B1ED7C4|nr:hypothetical protein [Streptomyces calidiresistens]